jgi:rhodanese-related sulfurtransferase
MNAPEDPPTPASANAPAQPDAARVDPGESGADPGEVGVDPSEIGVDPDEIGVDPAQLAQWLARDPELQVVDVREAYEREAGRIAGSRHIELVQLAGRAGELDGERAVVFYCRVGARSEMAAQAFRASGLRAHSLRGGLVRWAAEGRPLAPEDGHVADH